MSLSDKMQEPFIYARVGENPDAPGGLMGTVHQQIQVRDPMADALTVLGNNVGALAMAINRLAATQEHSKSRGAVSFSTASYDDQPDPQTVQLREIAKKRSESDNS